MSRDDFFDALYNALLAVVALCVILCVVECCERRHKVQQRADELQARFDLDRLTAVQFASEGY